MARAGDCKVETARRDVRQDCSERRRLQTSRKGEDGGKGPISAGCVRSQNGSDTNGSGKIMRQR